MNVPPPPGQPYGGHPQQGYVGTANPPNDSQATVSLVLGILSIFPCCAIGFILGPIAIFLSRGSQNRINASGGALAGGGLAQAGFILGIIGTALGVLVWIIRIIAFAVAGTHSLTGT